MRSPATVPGAEAAWQHVDCYAVIRFIREGTIQLNKLAELLFTASQDATKTTFTCVSALLADSVPVDYFLPGSENSSESRFRCDIFASC